MSSKYYFIVNPAAGGGKNLSCISDIQDFCRQKNLRHEIALTKAPKHATELAKKAALHYEVVVAVGGDGTVNEVSNGLIGSQAVLGIVPTGSGNDFSREVGLSKNIKKNLQKLLNGNVETIDVGFVDNRFYFVNAFGVGFDGEVASHAQKFMKFGRGFTGYLLSVLSTLVTYTFHRVCITIDSHEPINKEILFAAVANGTTYGGGFQVAPSAKINDGFFTICIVDKTAKLYTLRQLPKFMAGKHVSLPEVHMLTGKRVTIEASVPLQAQADGELPPPAKRFEIVMCPQQLKVLRAVR